MLSRAPREASPSPDRTGSRRGLPYLHHVLAIASVLLVLELRIELAPLTGNRPLLVVFLIPVVLSACVGGLYPGLTATFLTALSANYFLTSTAYSVKTNPPMDTVRWLLLLAAGILISFTAEAWHRARERDRSILEQIRDAKQRLLRSTEEAREIRTALDAHAIVAITDARGKITYVNDRFCAISGYSRAELVGQDHRIINSGFHSKAFFQDMWAAIRAGKVWHGEVKNRAKDGRHYWVDTTLVPFLDASGQPRQYIAIRADITEKKLGELALRASETRFRTILDNLMEGCQIIGRDWRYLYINAAAETHNRRPISSMLQQRITDCFPGIETTEVYATMQHCMGGGPAREMDNEFTYAEGAKAWFHLIIQPVPEGIFILSEDITARREAAAVLRRQQEDLRVLFDLIPAMIWFKDTQNRILRLNRLAAEEGGLSVAATEGRHASEIYPENFEGYYADDREVIASGRAKLGVVKQLKHAGGRPRWVQTDKVPCLDAEGRVTGLVVMAQDITARRESERALRESEERFRQLAENINEVFWIIDPALDRILYISPAYETVWGRSRERLYAEPGYWLDTIHAEDRQRVSAALKAGLTTGRYDETYRVARPNGSLRWIHDRGFPVRDEHGAIYRMVGTAEDITENRQLQTRFFQAQKMEAIGTLAGGIAHDFNNILGGIIGYTELARLRTKGDPRTTAYLDAVFQASHRAVDLVRQILAFSRHEEHEKSVVQLRHLVAESMQLLRATVPATIEFSISLAKADAVLADPSQIHQIVLNLCTNAVHAMKDRAGQLEVRLENCAVDESLAATLPPLQPGPHVRLSVSDTGCGMPASVMNRIFEPFFTTKAPGEGTGLGLSVVHGIVRGHAGAASVQSQPGVGTRFSLYFPSAPQGDAAIHLAPADAPEPGRGECILFVDDETRLAELGSDILDQLGYQVVTCNRPEDALKQFRASPAKFDLLITDLTMPEMTGLDLAREVLQLRPGLPVILMTGYSANLTAEHVRARGLSDLLFKPLTIQSLGGAIRRTLQGSSSRAATG